jgi:hypothetical protein
VEPADGTPPLADPTEALVAALCRTWSPSGGPTSDGIAVSRCTEQGYAGIVFASSPRAQELDALQETTGVGPGPTALVDRSVVLVDDLEEDVRTRSWVGFAEPALALGVASVYALPLQVGATVLGLLTLHGPRPGALAAAALPDFLRLGELTTTALLAPQLISPLLRTSDGEARASRLIDARHAVTHQAVGMVSVQADVSIADALVLLRARAIATDTPLADVARDVVNGRSTFSDTGTHAGRPPSTTTGEVERTDDDAD